ncbi:hypothetical protein J7T55_012170 [Diaporthe amygdali]|uniref:uncharacterized protein n=1 Tax=Phomopsis amygdali TaxID=1214568 RepID=UPI0022FE8D6E|nr:uncharacterized protein J7T55_012170 [Diaporthe amygdali]KAJ0123701.1 hypothetical protein J7T55_012170 [Diaporthe amygdali]
MAPDMSVRFLPHPYVPRLRKVLLAGMCTPPSSVARHVVHIAPRARIIGRQKEPRSPLGVNTSPRTRETAPPQGRRSACRSPLCGYLETLETLHPQPLERVSEMEGVSSIDDAMHLSQAIGGAEAHRITSPVLKAGGM